MRKTRWLIAILLGLHLLWAGVALIRAQARSAKPKTEESYTRPPVRQPVHPEIPEADRSVTDKVFLEYADSLFRPKFDLLERQIVKGNVKFRQGNTWLFCDSAYYYPVRNSMDAFGHVLLTEGDTVEVRADKAFYDGEERKAILVAGPSQRDVILKDPQGRLICDSLDYDLNAELGWYTTGGRIEDDVNVLTSVYGEYSPSTKQAKFRDNVVVVNEKEDFRMYTHELDYNTATHIADINSRTRIESPKDTIETTAGWYNTETSNAQLTARSTIFHTDSVGNVITLEGDSIIYDHQTGVSKAFMFGTALKLPKPMVLTDTARKVKLIGGYGEYHDSTQYAMSTIYPLLIEYSRADTLFLRADTVKSLLWTVRVWPDSLSHNWTAGTRTRLKSYPDIAAVGNDPKIDPQVPLLPYGFPAPQRPQEEVPVIEEMIDNNSVEHHQESRNEISSGDEVVGVAPDSDENEADAEPEIQFDTQAPFGTSDSGKLIRTGIDELGRDSVYMVNRPYHHAEAVGRARFFSQDMQGIADTIIFNELDSILRMVRKPIVWSETRQIFGDTILVHFNDSTPDWALLPTGGMVAEHIEEEFYNQLSGSKIRAFLEKESLRRLEVEGSVETIFLPMENDSTYTRMVSAESSYLTVDMHDGELEELKMWPEVTGEVTPLFMVKKGTQYLNKFKWYEYLRPVRSWYGSGWRWIDELGEVPEVLELYFSSP